MRPLRIADANTVTKHPRSVAATRMAVEREVPIKASIMGDTPIFESSWELTKEELFALNAGGAVRITCLGMMPPMLVVGFHPPEPSKEELDATVISGMGQVIGHLERMIGPIPLNLCLDGLGWMVGRLLVAIRRHGQLHEGQADQILTNAIKRGEEHQEQMDAQTALSKAGLRP